MLTQSILVQWMNAMVILVDTNVVLDFFMRREPFYSDAYAIMSKCRSGELSGYISLHAVPTIWYILRKIPESERRQILLDVCNLLTVASIGHDEVVDAIKAEDFHDFEDCIQDHCAEAISTDYIVTRNIDDFEHSKVKAVTPNTLLEILNK